MRAPWKGCNLHFEILEPRRIEREVYASTFNARGISAEAHFLARSGLIGMAEMPLGAELLNERHA
jgi:hypothetical protein